VEYHVDYLLGYYDSVLFGRHTTYDRVPSTGILLLHSYSLRQLSDVEAVESVGEDNSSGDNALSGAEVNQAEAQAPDLPQVNGEQAQYGAIVMYQKQILEDFKRIGVASVRADVVDKVRLLADEIKVISTCFNSPYCSSIIFVLTCCYSMSRMYCNTVHTN
jgi:hypothetical protein